MSFINKNMPKVKYFVEAFCNPNSPYFNNKHKCYEAFCLRPEMKNRPKSDKKRWASIERGADRFLNHPVVYPLIKKKIMSNVKALQIDYTPADVYNAYIEYMDIEAMVEKGVSLTEAYKLKGNAVKEILAHRRDLLKMQLQHGYGLDDEDVTKYTDEELAEKTMEAFKQYKENNLLESGTTPEALLEENN